jgi:hypothetical protein
MFGVAPVRPGWQRRLYQTQCRWNLRLSVCDPELKAKLTPKGQPMCKRMIFAGHYYRSVQASGVEVVTDPIARVEPIRRTMAFAVGRAGLELATYGLLVRVNVNRPGKSGDFVFCELGQLACWPVCRL